MYVGGHARFGPLDEQVLHPVHMHVLTGDQRLDQMAVWSFGLSDAYFFERRLSRLPVGVDVEFVELSILYWLRPDKTFLTPNAVSRLNLYMRQVGLLYLTARRRDWNPQTYLVTCLAMTRRLIHCQSHVMNRTFT